MRNTFLAVLAPLLLSLATAARADTKIAFVDYEFAGNACDEGKAFSAAFSKAQEEKLKPIKDKQTEFDGLRADFDKQQAVLSADARQQKAMELQKKGDELQQLMMQAQKELQQQNMEIVQTLGERIRGVVREIAERDGIQVVLAKESVVYAPDALDLTNEVIRRYNAKFPVKAGTTPATAKPPAKPAKPAKPAGK